MPNSAIQGRTASWKLSHPASLLPPAASKAAPSPRGHFVLPAGAVPSAPSTHTQRGSLLAQMLQVQSVSEPKPLRQRVTAGHGRGPNSALRRPRPAEPTLAGTCGHAGRGRATWLQIATSHSHRGKEVKAWTMHPGQPEEDNSQLNARRPCQCPVKLDHSVVSQNELIFLLCLLPVTALGLL